jgi:putative transposase
MPDMSDDWRNGRHVVYKLHAHIVLTPKYRRKVMTPRVTALLGETFSEVCARHDVSLEAFETDTEHAHLLVSYPPKLALSRLVMSLKTISSMRVRAQGWPEITRALWGDHFWSPSYAVVSAGVAPLDIVKQYIENQQNPNRPKGRPRQRTNKA